MELQNYQIDFNIPRIMGILNITPDSFSDGGKYLEIDHALDRARHLEQEGADIIDIGGESTRPGAGTVSDTEELRRVLPVIAAIRSRSSILMSIDTYKARVAEEALQHGVNWINDISGLRFDQEMVRVVKKWDCPVVVMHMLGSPQTMQVNPYYQNVIMDLHAFFTERIQCLNALGITKIILDPGIGFGKRLEDNFLILKYLDSFKRYGYPLLLGTSRKSFIGTVTGRAVEDRLAGTLATIAWSVVQGASVVRTHDVAAARDTVKMIDRIITAST
jgi:dihydropteroate synthase